jgi:hypothetical protein
MYLYYMPTPTDLKTYNKIKDEMKSMRPSAYKSGLIVQKYKREMDKKGKTPYEGRKNQNEGLSRWYREMWRSDNGSIGYDFKNSVYRPTVRITKDTPITFSELTKQQIEKAKQQKAAKGRVKNFKEIKT